MFACSRTLRSGRVISSNFSSKSKGNCTKTVPCKESDSAVTQSPLATNDYSVLNNAHPADDHGTTKPPSPRPSSKLAEKVNDIEDLVGGQRGAWGYDTGSQCLSHNYGLGVNIKQEPGACSVKEEPQEYCFNHGLLGMETFGGLGTYGGTTGMYTAGMGPSFPAGGDMGMYSGGMGSSSVPFGAFSYEMGTFGGMDIKQEQGFGMIPEELPLEVAVVKKRVRLNGEDYIHWSPPYWKEQYKNIRKMREDRTAPVDTNGCFMLAQKDVQPQVRRYQLLVSLMLSSQTKDLVTGEAMRKLTKYGLTVENILKTPREEIAKMIYGVGFWKKKAEYIKKSTEIISSKFSGDIPEDVKGLISLPGIGPKMAHLIMDFAWGKISGIGVDTHVHRIVHRLGWTPFEITNAEECREFLEAWFPREEWSDLNLLFVGFGQQTCTPIAPKCNSCMNKDICPASSTRPENEGKALYGKIGAKRKSPGKNSSTPSKRRVVKVKQEQC